MNDYFFLCLSRRLRFLRLWRAIFARRFFFTEDIAFSFVQKAFFKVTNSLSHQRQKVKKGIFINVKTASNIFFNPRGKRRKKPPYLF